MRSAGFGRRLVFLTFAVIIAFPGPARGAIDLRERLADQLVRIISFVMGVQTPTKYGIEASIVLATEAADLDPDNSERWYLLKSLAFLGEDEEAYRKAIEALTELEPDDDVVRLERVNLSLERFQNAEDRIAAYQRLLAPKFASTLGPAVRSHVALDLALLHQRRGDTDAFANAISEAATFDPSNRTAAALAAGFFRMNVDDPFAEAELLANLMLAAPVDLTTQIALSELLLDHGAYTGSARLYAVAVENQDRVGDLPPEPLLADYMTALWGAGRGTQALRVVNRRQQMLDENVQAQLYAEDPTLTALERSETVALLDPTLATTRAVIHAFVDHPRATESLQRAMESYDAQRNVIEDTIGIDVETALADLQLEKTWIALWLGRDVAFAEAELTALEDMRELPEATRALFLGWLELMRGEIDRSVELFEASTETAARFGLGLALEVKGDRAGAARAFLDVARAQPGSLMGVWSTNSLAQLLGARKPTSDNARRLEELIESIHPAFDRMTESPTVGVELNLAPRKMVYEPYEPVMVDLEIMNNSPFPLAISREGPIRPQVLISFSTMLSRMGRDTQLPPVVVDIDRRLRIEPHGRLVVPVDLRRFKLGEVLETYGRMGTFLKLKASLNFDMRPNGAIRPGLLGDEEWTDTIRIEGVRVDGDWLGAAVQTAGDLEVIGGKLDELQYRQMFVLSEMLTIQLSADAPPVHFRYLTMAGDALTDAYREADPIGQAWLLSIIPPQTLPASMTRLVQESDDRLVQIMYLSNHIKQRNDPLLMRLLNTTDPTLRVVIENIARQFVAPSNAE